MLCDEHLGNAVNKAIGGWATNTALEKRSATVSTNQLNGTLICLSLELEQVSIKVLTL